jgi:hypothetical protein
MARKKDDPVRRWLLEALETPEQKRRREEAKRRREEARLRQALAKIGLTPEEFGEVVREFQRRFYPDQE